jgi:8-oxo-dGTP pyrophosphatase MutT (NUDIX family)
MFLLLLKYPTYWGFSKGLIEDNENEKQAALREIEEEANIKNIEIIPGFENKQRFFFKLKGELIKKDCIFFLAKTTEEEAEKTKISFEHEDFAWLSLEEAINKTRVKNNKKLLEEAEKFIQDHEKQKKLV